MLHFASFAKALRYTMKHKSSLRTRYSMDGVLYYVVTPWKGATR